MVSDRAIEAAAEAYVAWCCQRDIGHFPVTDEDRDMARFMLESVDAKLNFNFPALMTSV